jgi:UDPglucose 6-dehydrogenase
MSNISVIGIGRLGLCFCLTLESAGYNVVGCDIDQNYVDSLNNKSFYSFEPGANEKLKDSQNFVATTSLSAAVEHAQMMFVTVASYSEPDGRYDVSQVDSVTDALTALGPQKDTKHLVICTNVNPGYSDTIHQRLKDLNWEVSFNPETIAQGTILKNQSEPDCIYIGSDTEELAQQISETYQTMCTNEPSIHIMDRLSAELTKVSLNCYLTCKISFANMVGDLATQIGADPDKVLSAVGSDSRINNKFFRYGFGWGGPCFPRDTRAFIRLAQNNNMPSHMCEASNQVNDLHLQHQINSYIQTGKTEYFTDSVTYKKGTVILEESQQLEYAVALAKRGIQVTVQESEEVTQILKNTYGELFNYV